MIDVRQILNMVSTKSDLSVQDNAKITVQVYKDFLNE